MEGGVWEEWLQEQQQQQQGGREEVLQDVAVAPASFTEVVPCLDEEEMKDVFGE